MKILLPIALFFIASLSSVFGQVTQINSNFSLTPVSELPNGKLILVSGFDSTVWVSDGTAGGTIPLSTSITYKNAGSLLGSIYIFKGNTTAEGIEIFKTDGTVGGTGLVSDINPGSAGSIPDVDFATLNGFVYFTAYRPAEGRELWRTNGNAGGTTLVKDIVAGPSGSNTTDNYHLFSNNSYLLLSVNTAAEGAELWKSDGSSTGTNLLSNINPGAASSNPDFFYPFNDFVFFQATDAARGTEFWKTNGTPEGTTIIKDINAGPGNVYGLINLAFFYRFNNRLYFIANDGTHGDEVWFTDGNEAGTGLLKDIQTTQFSATSVLNAVAVGNKFFFTSSDLTTRFEMWQSDGTPDGTTLFKSFSPEDYGGSPFIMPPYQIDFNNLTISQPLFQGNKFFFTAGTVDEGVELWVSDGTLPGTKMVKNIGPGAVDGTTPGTYAYTSANFYFAADNSVSGVEVYKSDATEGGTTIVADINPGAGDSDPLFYYYVSNGRLFFNATNGDSPTVFDLYVLEGVLPLPIHLTDFTVLKSNNTAMVKWTTANEINTRDFAIQRSEDGIIFSTIGTVAAAGNSMQKLNYQFADAALSSINKSKVYYRLQERSKDGSSSFSKVIALTLIGQQGLTIKILGNPVKNNIALMVSAGNEKVTLKIVDAGGRLMQARQLVNGSGLTTINLNGLKAGLYTLIAEGETERKLVKFVKQ